jgi:hypothetical protein
MREIRLYGSEGGGAGCSPYPYPGWSGRSCARLAPEVIDFLFHSFEYGQYAPRGSVKVDQQVGNADLRLSIDYFL